MAEGNGHGLTIDEFLQKHPAEKKAYRAELPGGGHVWFRRATFAEIRALGIAQDRGTPQQAAIAEVEHLARLWCLDEEGKPALDKVAKIHDIARRSSDAVVQLMDAYRTLGFDRDEVEAEAKN